MRWIAFIPLFFIFTSEFSKDMGFTKEDRERLIRLEATLRTFMEQTDKRFEELRVDMNKRFERVDKELNRIVTIMATIFAGQIGLVGTVIAFAWWDGRTIIRGARRQTIQSSLKGI